MNHPRHRDHHASDVLAAHPFVDRAWLDEHRDEVVLVDIRWYLDGRSGRAAYDTGHLPGAVFLDLDRWLAGPPSPEEGRHPLPNPDVFAHGMAAHGIGDDTVVVAYDDAGGVIAARLVWMLRVTGHAAALLDGGLASYRGALETTHPSVAPARFTPRPWPRERLATMGDLRGGALVIDARNRERYRGDADPIDPRAGHVPGAVNVPCRENIDEHGYLLPTAVIRERYEALGVDAQRPLIVYCGSGVTACHDLLTLESVGYAQARLFPGSWSQYSHAVDAPVALGDEPG